MLAVLLSTAVSVGYLRADSSSKGPASGALPSGASAVVPLKIADEPGPCELIGTKDVVAADDIDLRKLQTAYNNGDWQAVQDLLKTFVEKLWCHHPSRDPKKDYQLRTNDRYFSILFLNDAPTLPAPTLTRVLVHTPAPDLYSQHVIGVRLFDISLVQTDGPLCVTTTYVASATANPLDASIAKALGQVASGIGKGIPGITSTLDFEARSEDSQVHRRYSVRHVLIPEELSRSQIAVADTVLPTVLTAGKAAALTRASGAVADGIRTLLPLDLAAAKAPSVEAVAAASDLKERVKLLRKAITDLEDLGRRLLEGPTFVTDLTAVAADLSALAADEGALAADVVALEGYAGKHADVLTKVASDTAKASADGSKPLSDLTKAVGAAPPSIASSYSVGPRTQFDFSLGAGVIGRTSLNRRAKTDGTGTLVEDPLTGVLTFVAFNWHPTGFDETKISASWQERSRVMFGTALTPQAGVLVGIGYGFRTVQFVAGYGLFLSNVVRKEDRIGSTPTDPGHPTRRGGVGAPFLALEYTF